MINYLNYINTYKNDNMSKKNHNYLNNLAKNWSKALKSNNNII